MRDDFVGIRRLRDTSVKTFISGPGLGKTSLLDAFDSTVVVVGVWKCAGEERANSENGKEVDLHCDGWNSRSM